MRKIIYLFLVLSLFVFVSCGNEEVVDENVTEVLSITDSLGNEIEFDSQPETVVTLGSSLTDVWQLAGGVVRGTSSDSFDRGLGLDENTVVNIGAYNEPNVESILALSPDLVIMSSNISGQREIEPTLKSANVNVMYADINSFDEYLEVLSNFTKINDTPELYEQNGVAIQAQIDDMIQKASEMGDKTGLILRTSTAMLKVLPSDNFAVQIMENMGIENIANNDDAILEDINIESILKEDPYYIFLVVMGNDEEASMEKINTYIEQNPAWNTLTAVKEDRFIILPKELFHNKPNNRWGEAYEYIYNIRQENE